MPKIGVIAAIAGLVAVICFPSPGAAFGLNFGPFHLGLPLPGPVFGHRHRRAIAPREAARTKGLHDEADLNAVEPSQAPNSSLLYPAVTAPPIIEDVFWPSSAASSQWPFTYDAIIQTAFAKARPDRDSQVCAQPDRVNAIAARIRAEIRPTGAQMGQLQRLDGALRMAASYLAKTCSNQISAQPVARLRLMEWQIEKVAEALDIVRQPLQGFEQSLNKNQRDRFASLRASGLRTSPAGTLSCAATPTATGWSIEQISSAIEPDDAQRAAVANLQKALGDAARQLDASCPMVRPATPLARLEATEARLDTTWRAVVSMQVALANFESGLSEQQRIRLDATDLAESR